MGIGAPITDEEIDRAIDLREQGLMWRDVGAALGRQGEAMRCAVRDRARRPGARLPKKGRAPLTQIIPEREHLRWLQERGFRQPDTAHRARRYG